MGTPAEFMQAYEAATNSHELDKLLPLIAEDAIYLFSDQSCHIGKEAIAEAIQCNFDAIKAETYRIHDLKWLVRSDDIAACVYTFEWSGEIDGRPASGRGRGTTMLKRYHGLWRVAHEHLSHGGLD